MCVVCQLEDTVRLAADRGEEVARLKEQVQQQRDGMDAAGRDVLRRVEELRREFDAREEKSKVRRQAGWALRWDRLFLAVSRASQGDTGSVGSWSVMLSEHTRRRWPWRASRWTRPVGSVTS